MKIIIILSISFLFISCQDIILGPDQENTAKNNFELLWKRFDENYALFTVKNINWDSLHVVYGSRVTANTSESELWTITTELLGNLNDAHVSLLKNNAGFNASEISKRKRDDFSLKLITDKFLINTKTAGFGYFTYGKIKNLPSGKNIGYIYISTFAAYDNSPDWAYDIDKIVNELYDTDAIIIDLRNNGGGLKITLSVIASAFIDREITFFYQQEKNGAGHNDFGSKIPLIVSPREGVLSYNKKIALLTNRFSASGSEHFSQVFKNLSYSVQIGDTTMGAFGDILGFSQLPNGWIFSYPCRLTTTPDGKCPEGLGIIPDILIKNTKQGIDSGKDNILEYAVNYLSR